jgi:hypothetical protein
MSDRKHTPDILAEILTGDAPAAEVEFTSSPTPPKRPTAPRKPVVKKAPETGSATGAPEASPAVPKTAKERRGGPVEWEFQVVSFQEHAGLRVRYIDGQKVREWTEGPTLIEYNRFMGEQGWELAGACSGTAMFGHQDAYQLFYKRPKM